MLIVAFLVMFIVPLVPFKFDNCITIWLLKDDFYFLRTRKNARTLWEPFEFEFSTYAR